MPSCASVKLVYDTHTHTLSMRVCEGKTDCVHASELEQEIERGSTCAGEREYAYMQVERERVRGEERVCMCSVYRGKSVCSCAACVTSEQREREREREKERVCVCARASKLMTEQERGSTCTRDRKYVRM